jgi:hypothetical protein
MTKGMLDEHGWEYNYASYPIELDRMRDRLQAHLPEKVSLVFGELLRQTIGFCRGGVRSWEHELSPGFVSRGLGTDKEGKRIVPYSTVKDSYKYLEKRNVIRTRLVPWKDNPKKKITLVEINRFFDEWCLGD